MTSLNSSVVPHLPRPWQPGDTLEFDTFKSFQAFEDELCSYIETPIGHLWLNRPDLDSYIRPKVKGRTFLGTLRDVNIVFIDPQHCIEDITLHEKSVINIAGKLINASVMATDILHQSQQSESSAIAFDLFVRAFSSGRGEIGALKTKLLYAPTPVKDPLRERSRRQRDGLYVYGLRRFMGKAEISSEGSFEDLVAASIQNARPRKNVIT